MRVKTAALALLLCLVFAGCQKKDNHLQQALDFRTKILGSGGCQFACQIEADFGDKAYNFSLDCCFDGEDGKLTVTAPQNVAGITAVVDGDDASLEFDGLSLEYGQLANGHIAPLTIPWLLGSAWAEDYISQVDESRDYTRVTYLKGYHDEEVSVDTWFYDDIPTYCEVSYGGHRVLAISIQNFAFLK